MDLDYLKNENGIMIPFINGKELRTVADLEYTKKDNGVVECTFTAIFGNKYDKETNKSNITLDELGRPIVNKRLVNCKSFKVLQPLQDYDRIEITFEYYLNFVNSHKEVTIKGEDVLLSQKK